MKLYQLLFIVSCLAVLAGCAATQDVSMQERTREEARGDDKPYTELYQFNPAKVPVGQVFHYLKSNIDGSNPTHLSVYFANANRIEAFRWQPNRVGATLVTADYDWSKFSVKHFGTWHLEGDGAPQHRASMIVGPDGRMDASFLTDRTIELSHWPWHSYDFEFVSLNLLLPHVKDKQKDIVFWRSDIVFSPTSLDFAEIGKVVLRLDKNESQPDLNRYTITGPGLGNTQGKLWTDASTGFLVGYQIPIPDEPGYTSGRLELLETESMSLIQWDTFKQAKASGS